MHILVDGVSSQRTIDRSVALRRMEKAGAFMTTSESLLFELLGDSTNTNFKVSRIVLRESCAKRSVHPRTTTWTLPPPPSLTHQAISNLVKERPPSEAWTAGPDGGLLM